MITRLLRVLRTVLWGTVVVIVVVVAVVAWWGPETTSVTARGGDVEWRHLDPAAAPTTTARTSTGAPATTTTATSATDVVLVIHRGRVITVPRTPLVEQLLLLATIQETTR